MAIADVNDGDILEETDWDSVITTVENTSTGHRHDGADSRVISSSSVVGNVYVVKQGGGSENGDSGVAIVDSVSFTANQLAATDAIEVLFFLKADGAGTAPEWKFTVTNTTATGDLTALQTTNISNSAFLDLHLAQDIDENDIINSWYIGNSPDAGSIASTGALDTNDANVFATAWTLNLGIDANGNVSEWWWMVKVLKAV